jgi:glucokinase
LGIDIGGTSVKMGILDPVQGLVDVKSVATVPDAPELMADKIAELARGYGADIIGVGTAGRVNSETGLVSAGNLGWRDVPLGEMLGERLGKPIWVDNDAQAALMAEWHSGSCKGADCAVYITLGTGVGGALLIDGKPWRGRDNTAFELGHIITHGDGLQCVCSRKGCYEQYASGSALSRMAGGKPVREVIDLIQAGDPVGMTALGEYAHELAIGIESVAALFAPQVVVIGGGISAIGETLIETVRRDLSAQGNPSAEVSLATHQNSAGMIGAAVLAEMHL